MDLDKGQSRVEFMGVPETIEPESLQVISLSAPDGLSVMDMNYEYDLVSVKNLMDRYVGRSLQVLLPPQENSEVPELRDATLIANNDRPVFDLGGEIYVGPFESVLLPGIPEGLRPHPTLVWLVDNKGPSRQDVQVSYLADAVSWRADYVLKVDRDEKSASLSGWVTLDNKSGMAFENAGLKLVAGDVNRVTRPTVRKQNDMVFAAQAEAEMRQEEFFEYHLYDVGRKVDVGNRQTKQIRLLSATGLGVRKELVSEYVGYRVNRQAGPGFEQPVHVHMVFKNSEDNNLGMPLPRGIVRAYQQSVDGTALLIGEDNIEHTPDEAEVRLTMGRAFDVKVERTLLENRDLGNTRRISWEIKVTNSKDEPVDLALREIMTNEWDMVTASHEYVKESARHLRFDVTVPPVKKSGPLTVRYEVLVND
jgi:hypothetical protein